MSSIQKTLIQKQMDELIQSFVSGKQSVQTSAGWIQSARLSLGMSLRQLAEWGSGGQYLAVERGWFVRLFQHRNILLISR